MAGEAPKAPAVAHAGYLIPDPKAGWVIGDRTQHHGERGSGSPIPHAPRRRRRWHASAEDVLRTMSR